MPFPTEQSLHELVEPLARRAGLDLEEIKAHKAGAKSSVSVFVDADERPDLDALEALSQEISQLFDAAEAAGELSFGAQGYTLEVSTPGVERPLSLPRHFRRNRGRLLSARLGEEKIEGRIGALNEAEDELALVVRAGAAQKGRAGKKLQVLRVRLAELSQAVVKIEFAAVPEEERAVAEADFDQAIA